MGAQHPGGGGAQVFDYVSEFSGGVKECNFHPGLFVEACAMFDSTSEEHAYEENGGDDAEDEEDSEGGFGGATH
jgi:hypothetical protein